MAVTVERTFNIEPAPAMVLSYLEDFSNDEEWDPGTVQCTRRDSGPVQVGSSWDNTSKFAGNTTELLYRLATRTSEQLVFVGHNERATSTDTITVTPSGAGSQVHYRAELELQGVMRFVAPVVKFLFERVADRTRDQMQTVLDRLVTR
jgi:carbon monoxide dehydrogenase subunit G